MRTHGKFLVTLAVLGVVSLMGSVVSADSVILYQNVYSSGYGGEFTADYTGRQRSDIMVQGDNVTVQRNQVYTNGATISDPNYFQTFCIQQGSNDVVFYPGAAYDAKILATIDRGPGAVQPGVAYLFDQFWKGTLTGYNFDNTLSVTQPLSRQQTAGALQAAIWFLEGDDATLEAAYGDARVTPNSAQSLLAESFVATALLPENKNVVIRDVAVQILQLTYPDGTTRAQSQLIEISNPNSSAVPLPASVGVGFSMLGGFGMLAKLRKRLRRQSRIA